MLTACSSFIHTAHARLFISIRASGSLFSREKTEAQRGEMTCPRSQLLGGEKQNVTPGLFKSRHTFPALGLRVASYSSPQCTSTVLPRWPKVFHIPAYINP